MRHRPFEAALIPGAFAKSAHSRNASGNFNFRQLEPRSRKNGWDSPMHISSRSSTT